MRGFVENETRPEAVSRAYDLLGLRDPMEDTVKSDFRKMASRAKQAYHEQSRIEKEVASAAKTARDQETEAMISSLKKNVLGLLEEARAGFEAEGIRSELKNNFDSDRRYGGTPMITFRCLIGLESKGETPRAPAVFFFLEGQTIKVWAGRESSAESPDVSIGAAEIGDADRVVKEGIERALNAYFEEIDRLNRRRGSPKYEP